MPPTTGAQTTSQKAPSTGAATEMLTTCALTTTGEPGTTAEPTTVTPCVNLCNDCEPPLECEYLITLEDLGGAFGPFNGSWCVPYTGRVGDNCAYILPFDIEDYPNANLWMTWDYVAPLCWGVIAALEGGCGKTWKRQIVPAAYCQPLGVYSEAWCVSDNCIWGDPDPCPPSAGATCVVSDC